MEYKQAYFGIDSCPTLVQGYTRGERWNGWQCPCFTKEVVDKYIETEDMRTAYKVVYNESKDTYILYDNYVEDDDEPLAYEGHDIEINGVTKHVYDLGSWAWVWDKYTEEELKRNNYDWIEEIIKE